MPKLHFKTIGIVGTHRNPLVAKTVKHLLALLGQWGVTGLLEQQTAETQGIGTDAGYPFSALGEKCDLVVAVGGDGNLLHTARILAKTKTPVIGVNRGQFGYLTDISPDALEEQLLPILQGKVIKKHHFLIEAQIIRSGEVIEASNALNDIVLFPGPVAQLIEFELKIDGKFVYSQRSDGLIISTPTGSTAYALSAGGPIIQPDLDVLLLVPKFPHTLTSRPIVISGDSQIELIIGDYNKISPRLSFDGHAAMDLKKGDVVKINKQPQPLTLIYPAEHDYYQNLRNKLGWSKSLVTL